MQRDAVIRGPQRPLVLTGHSGWSRPRACPHRAPSGIAGIAHQWSRRQNHHLHDWDTRPASARSCSHRQSVSCVCASPPGVPPAAVEGGQSRDVPPRVRPSAGYSSSETQTVDSVLTAHGDGPPTRVLPPAWLPASATTVRNSTRHARRSSPRRFVPNTPLRCVWQPGFPVFSDDFFSIRLSRVSAPIRHFSAVFSFQRPQTLGVSHLHTATNCFMPRIHGSFRNNMLTAHLTDVVQRLSSQQKFE